MSSSHKRSEIINNYFENFDKPRILILGDSHLGYAIKNKFLKSDDISLAYHGDNLYNWYIYYNFFVDSGKIPDYVFIESGNHLMSEKRFTDSSSLIGHFNYILLNKNNFDFVGYKKFIKITLLTLFPFISDSTPNAVRTFFKMTSDYDKNHNIISRLSLDYFQKDYEFVDNEEIISKRTNLLYSKKSTQFIEKYKKLIGFFISNGSKVYLINSPLHSKVQSQQNDYIFKQLNNNQVKLLDFTESIPDSMFNDIDHIKSIHSQYFTDLFYDKLNFNE